jgi:hypothetical protein
MCRFSTTVDFPSILDRRFASILLWCTYVFISCVVKCTIHSLHSTKRPRPVTVTVLVSVDRLILTTLAHTSELRSVRYWLRVFKYSGCEILTCMLLVKEFASVLSSNMINKWLRPRKGRSHITYSRGSSRRILTSISHITYTVTSTHV